MTTRSHARTFTRARLPRYFGKLPTKCTAAPGRQPLCAWQSVGMHPDVSSFLAKKGAGVGQCALCVGSVLTHMALTKNGLQLLPYLEFLSVGSRGVFGSRAPGHSKSDSFGKTDSSRVSPLVATAFVWAPNLAWLGNFRYVGIPGG